MKNTAYNTLVPPMVEFAPAVWDPYTVGNIRTLEKVQRWATRYVLNWFYNHSSVREMMTELGWTSLESTDNISNCRCSVGSEMTLWPLTVTRTSPLLSVQQGSVTSRDISSLNHPQTAISTPSLEQSDWNGITDSIVSAPSLAAFKARLLQTSKTAYLQTATAGPSHERMQ